VAELEAVDVEHERMEAQEFQALVEHSPDVIARFDQDLRYRYVNPAAETATGIPAAAFIGKTATQLGMPQELLSVWQQTFHTVFTKGQEQMLEFAFPTPSGLRYYQSRIVPEFAKDGSIPSALLIARDTTERVLTEQARHQAHETALQQVQLENVYLQEEIRGTHNFEEIIGTSATLTKVLHDVECVAGTDATVLITGETGTGKELIARALHTLDPRKNKPLIKVNCAALPEGLIESELFGHEKGAFTGAISRKMGRFELAHGGTIFLDEIGDLPLELQAKLLKVLQDGEFERLGGSQTLRVNVRVIAATNRDLKKALAEQTFRADLYYRLDVFPIHLPPLRERIEDIPLLVRYFANKYMLKIGKPIETIDQQTLQRLIAYPWPGNIRELEHTIEHAVIVSTGPTLRIPEERLCVSPVAQEHAVDVLPLAEAERSLIVKALEKTHWVVEGPHGAAKILNLHPSTLRARMRKLSIRRDPRLS
jgi:PAS domain S-box-containing protein